LSIVEELLPLEEKVQVSSLNLMRPAKSSGKGFLDGMDV
jgi:hypothetical protein